MEQKKRGRPPAKPTEIFSEVIENSVSPTKDSILYTWEAEGISCYYVRFQQPVPPSVNKEPVSEFALQSKQGKYVVDKITYTLHGLIWRAGGEIDITALANVMYVRAIQVGS